MGDLTGTIIVISATAILKRENVIKNKVSEKFAIIVSLQCENQIRGPLKIVMFEVMV